MVLVACCLGCCMLSWLLYVVLVVACCHFGCCMLLSWLLYVVILVVACCSFRRNLLLLLSPGEQLSTCCLGRVPSTRKTLVSHVIRLELFVGGGGNYAQLLCEVMNLL